MVMTSMFGEVKLVYFKGEGLEPVDNWRVFAGELHIGFLHNCDGVIGGYVWDDEFMDGDDFDRLCEEAENDTNKV